MSRPLALLGAAACVAVGSAAPALKDGGPNALYTATHVGDKRVYELRAPAGTTEHSDVVTAVEKKDGALRVKIGRLRGGETTPYADLEVSEKGLVRHMAGGNPLAKPVPCLKLPHKVGETWEEPEATGGKTTYTVGKAEEVEVPAGKYRAIRIDSVTDQVGSSYKAACWYAPGVGLVKMVADTGGTKFSQLLKSFTPGKD
jgi:hypothetical protein